MTSTHPTKFTMVAARSSARVTRSEATTGRKVTSQSNPKSSSRSRASANVNHVHQDSAKDHRLGAPKSPSHNSPGKHATSRMARPKFTANFAYSLPATMSRASNIPVQRTKRAIKYRSSPAKGYVKGASKSDSEKLSAQASRPSEASAESKTKALRATEAEATRARRRPSARSQSLSSAKRAKQSRHQSRKGFKSRGRQRRLRTRKSSSRHTVMAPNGSLTIRGEATKRKAGREKFPAPTGRSLSLLTSGKMKALSERTKQSKSSSAPPAKRYKTEASESRPRNSVLHGGVAKVRTANSKGNVHGVKENKVPTFRFKRAEIRRRGVRGRSVSRARTMKEARGHSQNCLKSSGRTRRLRTRGRSSTRTIIVPCESSTRRGKTTKCTVMPTKLPEHTSDALTRRNKQYKSSMGVPAKRYTQGTSKSIFRESSTHGSRRKKHTAESNTKPAGASEAQATPTSRKQAFTQRQGVHCHSRNRFYRKKGHAHSEKIKPGGRTRKPRTSSRRSRRSSMRTYEFTASCNPGAKLSPKATGEGTITRLTEKNDKIKISDFKNDGNSEAKPIACAGARQSSNLTTGKVNVTNSTTGPSSTKHTRFSNFVYVNHRRRKEKLPCSDKRTARKLFAWPCCGDD